MNSINIENGDFVLNTEMILKANENFNDVNNFNSHMTTSFLANDQEQIYFKNLNFYISICFFKCVVKFITFTISHSTNRSWNDWVEVVEKKKLKKQKIG